MLLRNHHADAVEVRDGKKDLYLPPVDVHFLPKIWDYPDIANTIGPWAYALDLPRIGKAKPGRLSYEEWTDVFEEKYPQTPDEFAVAVGKDGLFYYDDFLPEEGHVIAAFAKPGKRKNPAEILIARRDSNGLWSYTAEGGGCGDYYPQQVDLRGAEVTDIRKAYFCGYDEFLGFAAIPYAGISYYPRVDLSHEGKNLFIRDIPALYRQGLDL